jgi:hypothetical protein
MEAFHFGIQNLILYFPPKIIFVRLFKEGILVCIHHKLTLEKLYSLVTTYCYFYIWVFIWFSYAV